MMVVGKKIEELIARLAQKARAAGHPPDPGDAAAERRRDHRPDQGQHPDAHRVPGVEQDRLAHDPRPDGRRSAAGAGRHALPAARHRLPVRVHGAFVTDDEVHRVVAYLKTQGEPNYIEGILEGGTLDGDEDGDGRRGPAAAAKPIRCTTRRSRSCCSTGGVDLAGAAPPAHRLQPRRAAAGTNGEIRPRIRHGDQRQPRHPRSRRGANEVRNRLASPRRRCWPRRARADAVDTLRDFVAT